MSIVWPLLTKRESVSNWRASIVAWCILVLVFIALLVVGFQNAVSSSQEVSTAMVQSHTTREPPIVEICDYWYLPGFGNKYRDAWKSDWEADGVELEHITALHQAGRVKFHIRHRAQTLDASGKTKKADRILKLDSKTGGFAVNYSAYHDKYPCLQVRFTPDVSFRSDPEHFIFDKLRVYVYLQHRKAAGNRPLVWRALPPGGEYSLREKLSLDKYIPGGSHRMSAKVRVRTTEYATQDLLEALWRKLRLRSEPKNSPERYQYEQWEELALTQEWMQWYYWPLLLDTLEPSLQAPVKNPLYTPTNASMLQFVGVEFEFDTLYTEKKTEKNALFHVVASFVVSFVAAFPLFGLLGEIWCVDIIATVKQRKRVVRVPSWTRLRTFEDKVVADMEDSDLEEEDYREDSAQEMTRVDAHPSTRRRTSARSKGSRRNPLATALRPLPDAQAGLSESA